MLARPSRNRELRVWGDSVCLLLVRSALFLSPLDWRQGQLRFRHILWRCPSEAGSDPLNEILLEDSIRRNELQGRAHLLGAIGRLKAKQISVALEDSIMQMKATRLFPSGSG